MNEDIKDILLDLDDDGYTIYYKGDSVSITLDKRNFKIKEVKHIIQRLFDYNQKISIYKLKQNTV